MIKKALIIILSLILALSFLGCEDNGETTPTDELEVLGYEKTDEDFTKNGVSAYKVITSIKASARENLAKDELLLFTSKVTGVVLPSFTDDLPVLESDKIISIGETTLLQKSGISVTYSELGSDGFKIITKDNTIFLIGFGGDGTLFSVYEFLKLNLGVKFMAEDEIKITEQNNVKINKYNFVSRPAFEERALGYFATQGNDKNALRMRLGEGVGNWGLWSHTHFTIINYDLPSGQTYKTTNPEWFSSDGTQLCLVNAKMKEKFVANLKKIIEKESTAEYFMLGQEDVNTFCSCDECVKSIAENGGEGGAQMIFVNKVAQEIESWLTQNHPDRNVLLVTFAYALTEAAPAKYDEATDSYSPINENVVARDNVGVMFAPIYACFSHSILNKDCNSLSRGALLGWNKVSKKVLIWTYSANYAAYLQPFNNYSTVSVDYNAFQDNGVMYIYDQGIFNSYDSFHDLRVYVKSKLLWAPNANVAELENEFFAQYYSDASPMIKEYYELIKTHYMVLEQEGRGEEPVHAYCTWNLGVLSLTNKFWPKSFLNQCLSIFESAYAQVDKMEDKVLAAKILTRVKRESLFVRYMLLELYPVYYSTNQLKAMIDTFEFDAYSSDVTRYISAEAIVGGPPLSKKLDYWRNNLL